MMGAVTVLSFDTVHAITDHLYRFLANAAHPTDPHDAAPTAALLVASLLTAPHLIRPFDLVLPGADQGALPDQLLLTAAITATTTFTTIRTRAQGSRTSLSIACTVRYIDLPTRSGAAQVVRRVDALDTDGRLYRLTGHGDTEPFLLIDDCPARAELPATHAGLAAVLTAATRSVPADGIDA
jgi:hypothetical protein